MNWRYLYPVLLLIAGAVLGPVAIAAGQALLALADPELKRVETVRLVETYRERLPPFRLMLTVLPPDTEQCGYDSDQLFPLEDSEKANASYWGLSSLDAWRNQRSDEIYLSQVTDLLERRMSSFTTVFLRRCMEATLFAGWCEARVRAISSAVRPVDRTGSKDDDRIICTYLDGVAARSGKPLAKRTD